METNSGKSGHGKVIAIVIAIIMVIAIAIGAFLLCEVAIMTRAIAIKRPIIQQTMRLTTTKGEM